MPTGCRAFGLLAVALFVVAMPQRGAAQAGGEFEWRFPLKQDTVAPSNIEAENICFKTHTFQVEPETLPFMRLMGPSSFSVNPGQSHKVPVQFDTRNMKPGQYEAVIKVRCMTCRGEKGCRQDHKDLHVYLTVVPGAPNWSNVFPEQKGLSSRSPTLRWSAVAPEKKPK